VSLAATDMATLIALCIAWFSIALALVLVLVGRGVPGRRPRGTAYRWLGAGLLMMCTGAVVRQFGEVRKWPLSQLLAVDNLNLALGLAAFACAITGVVAGVRSRHATGRVF